MAKDKEFNSKGDRVSSRDNDGYTCRTDKDRGTCTNNKTGESVNVSRNNDNSWSIDTSNTGNRNTFGSNYPSNFRDNDKDYGSYSGGQSLGGSNNIGYSPQELHVINTVKALGSSVLGASTHDSRKYKTKDCYNASIKGTIESINYYGYKGQKGLLFSDYDLTAHDMNYLSATMPSNNYNFTLVDFSHNPRIKELGLDYLLKGATGITSLQQGNTDISLMYQGMLTRSNFNIVKLDLGNCSLGDTGADILSHALANGKLLTTKHIDVSGNNFTLSGEKFIVNALQQEIVQDVLVTLKRSYNIKTMISGNKEQKQFLIKETLQVAQDNGVDVKNVAVSKDMGTSIKNGLSVLRNFGIGFGKCYIVPEDTQTFAGERILAKASKKVFGANNAKDAVVCFFDTIDEVLTSNEGVHLIKDLDLFGANEVIDSIE